MPLLPLGVPPTQAPAMLHTTSFPRHCSSEGAHHHRCGNYNTGPGGSASPSVPCHGAQHFQAFFQLLGRSSARAVCQFAPARPFGGAQVIMCVQCLLDRRLLPWGLWGGRGGQGSAGGYCITLPSGDPRVGRGAMQKADVKKEFAFGATITMGHTRPPFVTNLARKGGKGAEYGTHGGHLAPRGTNQRLAWKRHWTTGRMVATRPLVLLLRKVLGLGHLLPTLSSGCRLSLTSYQILEPHLSLGVRH